MYANFFKRFLDFWLALLVLLFLSPVLLILTVVGAVVMKGNPFFTQLRPGKDERIFKLVKFRSMTCQKDKNGNLLPDEARLVPYGKLLRSTSMDELPELWNILKGDMAIVGPRPLLVKDVVFMTPEQRERHTVRQGLTGLAQVNGRNSITWEQKLDYDLQYITTGITLRKDIGIVLKTIGKVFKRSDTIREGTVSDLDLGDYLLQKGKIDQKNYDGKQVEARELLNI